MQYLAWFYSLGVQKWNVPTLWRTCALLYRTYRHKCTGADLLDPKVRGPISKRTLVTPKAGGRSFFNTVSLSYHLLPIKGRGPIFLVPKPRGPISKPGGRSLNAHVVHTMGVVPPIFTLTPHFLRHSTTLDLHTMGKLEKAKETSKSYSTTTTTN